MFGRAGSSVAPCRVMDVRRAGALQHLIVCVAAVFVLSGGVPYSAQELVSLLKEFKFCLRTLRRAASQLCKS